ncbi:hypothetical protein [Endozoicomonas sp. ALE010]|uniref:hypothetical protein n=1 Tax=Endozoicomonas sp. ALE010 TaxID=3403081 RepID=UPI003BB4EA20
MNTTNLPPIYNSCPITGEYLPPLPGEGQPTASPNPRNPDNPLVPAYASLKKPPPTEVNEKAKLDHIADTWSVEPDFRGSVFNKETKEKSNWTELGNLPEHLTKVEPATRWDKWIENSGQWQTDIEARQKDLCKSYCDQLDSFASTVRARFISGGDNTTTEYELTRDEALIFKSAGYEGEVPGTVQIHMNSYGVDAQTAVQQILTMNELSRNAIKQVRAVRLPGKELIKKLPPETTEEAFKAEFDKLYSQLDVIEATF